MEPIVKEEPPRLIEPAPDADSFMVDGITYTLEPELTVARARMLQRFQLELGYDQTLASIIQTVDKGWAALNGNQLATGIYEFGRLRESLNGVGEGRMSDVNICALFYNAPGEDLGYNHAAMLEKMRKWEKVAAGFFLVAAFARLTATSTRYPLPAAALNQPPPTTSAPLPNE
ncbi:hypothetical protein [Hymenobacter tenuis]